jgi:hypothetical protein
MPRVPINKFINEVDASMAALALAAYFIVIFLLPRRITVGCTSTNAPALPRHGSSRAWLPQRNLRSTARCPLRLLLESTLPSKAQWQLRAPAIATESLIRNTISADNSTRNTPEGRLPSRRRATGGGATS